jgi:hypothetical protein
MKSIIDIITSIDTHSPNLNPTVIYNEGWMTRLLVNQSLKEKTIFSGLDFGEITNWTSEALISSPFVRAPKFREGYTHADIALGDFEADYKNRGEIIIHDTAKVFGIIEAKMGSNLSKRTTHFDNYNQASRNLACICSQTYNKNCKIFFIVAAPRPKFKEHEIEKQIDLKSMIQQIRNRFNVYSDDFKSKQNMELIIAKAESCLVQTISFEEWIEAIVTPDSKQFLQDFYNKAKAWNRIK